MKFNNILKVLSGLLFTSIFISCGDDNQNNFKEPGIHHIKAVVGSDFTFSLPQIKTSGFELVWINKPNMKNMHLKDIKEKLKDANNVNSGGETMTYTFNADAKGTDTIKMSNCPTSLWQKEATFFEGDSVRNRINGTFISEYVPYRSADYMIVVDVE